MTSVSGSGCPAKPVSIPTLPKMVASGRIPAEKLGTHSFTFAQILRRFWLL
jgi:hypothetical protein